MTDFSRYSWTDCFWTTTGRPSVEHHGRRNLSSSSSNALPNDAKKSVRSCGVIAQSSFFFLLPTFSSSSSPILIFLSPIFFSPSRRVFHTTTQCYRICHRVRHNVTQCYTPICFPCLSVPLSVCLRCFPSSAVVTSFVVSSLPLFHIYPSITV